MLMTHRSAEALTNHKKDQLGRNATRARLGRKLAAVVVGAALALGACGVPVAETPEQTNLVVDSPPVGSPNLSELRGYEYPEMLPRVLVPTLQVDSYEHPEMWPLVENHGSQERTSGPR